MYFLENEENAKKKVFPNKLDLNVVSNPNKCERNNERFFFASCEMRCVPILHEKNKTQINIKFHRKLL